LNVGDQQRELVLETPRPVFVRLDRAHDGMAGGLGVVAGVVVGGVIAAAHFPALETDPQMHPLAAARETILTAVD
jgi:hypothetical protein